MSTTTNERDEMICRDCTFTSHTCQLSISNSSLSSCWPTSDLCFTFTAERPSANRRQSTVRSVRGCQNVTHCRLDTASYYSYCLSCDHYIKCLQSVYVKIFGPIFHWNRKNKRVETADCSSLTALNKPRFSTKPTSRLPKANQHGTHTPSLDKYFHKWMRNAKFLLLA